MVGEAAITVPGTAVFVNCTFASNNTVLGNAIKLDVSTPLEIVVLEGVTLSNGGDILLQEGTTSFGVVPSVQFYSDTPLTVAVRNASIGFSSPVKAGKTLPLSEVPAEANVLSADDLWFVGVQKVCDWAAVCDTGALSQLLMYMRWRVLVGRDSQIRSSSTSGDCCAYCTATG